MKRAVLFLCLAFVGCASTRTPRLPSAAEERARLHPTSEMTTAPSYPMSLEAAYRLANEYFHTFFGDCGAIGRPIEKNDSWIFSTAVGYAGTKGPNIVVAKSGLCVFSRGGAPIFWIDGRWRFDPAKYQSFLANEDVERDKE